jgi:hypothetical protein
MSRVFSRRYAGRSGTCPRMSLAHLGYGLFDIVSCHALPHALGGSVLVSAPLPTLRRTFRIGLRPPMREARDGRECAR